MAPKEPSEFARKFGTPVTKIRNQMQEWRLKKWGLLVYRCTYGDDKAWERFMEILYERTRDDIETDELGPAPDLLETLEWTVKEDRATLDGASVDKVRDLFNAWVASDEAKADRLPPGTGDPATAMSDSMLGMSPRHAYCLHVDAEALESVVSGRPLPPPHDYKSAGYVNLVDAVWEPDEEYEDDPHDQSQDIGYMRVTVDGFAPWFYSFLVQSGGYYVIYRKPPTLVH